jgi:Spy/CpxP family protein refolding chaperone
MQPRLQEVEERVRQEIEKLASILKEERVDERALLAQFDELQAVEKEVRKAHLALLIGIKNTLSPEQQKRLRELKANPVPQW